MAENTQKSDTQHAPSQPSDKPKPGDTTPDEQKTNPGTPDRGTFTTADTAVADAAGLSEGEVKALRDNAGLNQLAGNEANTLAWESTPAGQEFLKGENKDEAKEYEESREKDSLSPAEVKYREAVDKARKG
jgi:hypothetical protein